MYLCPLCDTTCSTDRVLLGHWKLKHSISKNQSVQCKQVNCSRKLTNFYSFLRHIKRDHSPTNIPIRNQLSSPTIIQPSTEPHTTCHASTDCITTPETVTNKQSSTSPITSLKYANDITFSYAYFISRLHAIPSISRHLVQEITDDVKTLFTLTKPLQDEINTANGTKALSEINTRFEILQNAFIDHEREHQSLKYFQNLGTYIPPNTFTSTVSLEQKKITIQKEIWIKWKRKWPLFV